eukprot:7764047-Pyramimonas_sp.AAC.2
MPAHGRRSPRSASVSRYVLRLDLPHHVSITSRHGDIHVQRCHPQEDRADWKQQEEALNSTIAELQAQ